MENIPNRMFLEYFLGLAKVTKESCCYGYPVTKEKENGKSIFWGYHALCFSENRKGIYQIYPKIEDLFNLFIFG